MTNRKNIEEQSVATLINDKYVMSTYWISEYITVLLRALGKVCIWRRPSPYQVPTWKLILENELLKCCSHNNWDGREKPHGGKWSKVQSGYKETCGAAALWCPVTTARTDTTGRQQHTGAAQLDGSRSGVEWGSWAPGPAPTPTWQPLFSVPESVNSL